MSNKLAEKTVRRNRVATPRVAKKRKPAFGLVNIYVQGASDKEAPLERESAKVISMIEAGLPFRDFAVLQKSLDMTGQKLADKLSIPKATFQRRKLKGRFDLAESERLVRFARLLGRAAHVMKSVENGRRWLTSSQYGLGGAVPLDYAKTEIGARAVEDLLGRIEYGVYS